MHRFFVEPSQVEPGKIVIRGGDVNHMRNVLRMKPGEEFVVSVQERDGTAQTPVSDAQLYGVAGGEYYCVLRGYGEQEAMADIAYHQCSKQELPSRITLYQGLPKADKMELIIQKAVELGAYRIVPVMTKRTVVKLEPSKEEKKRQRWNAIAESAAKQSGRGFVPEVMPVMSFPEAIGEAEKAQCGIIPYELAEDMEQTRKLFSELVPGQDITVFIGPEGGFEEAEVAYALSHGVRPVTLGKRILRTETAGLCVLSILMYHLEGR